MEFDPAEMLKAMESLTEQEKMELSDALEEAMDFEPAVELLEKKQAEQN